MFKVPKRNQDHIFFWTNLQRMELFLVLEKVRKLKFPVCKLCKVSTASSWILAISLVGKVLLIRPHYFKTGGSNYPFPVFVRVWKMNWKHFYNANKCSHVEKIQRAKLPRTILTRDNNKKSSWVFWGVFLHKNQQNQNEKTVIHKDDLKINERSKMTGVAR